MMGNKRAATIRKEIRAAFAADGMNPLAYLDAEIRKAERKRKVDPGELESLFLLRDALARGKAKRRQPKRPSGTRRTRKAPRVAG
jgi:hypothetical protein